MITRKKSFNEEILEFINQQNANPQESKKQVLELVKRASAEAKKTDESEKTHPVYFALLYLVSAQFCVFEEKEGWEKNSDQYVKKALSFLKKNQDTLMQDAEWLKYREKLMELLNHHFLLLINKLINILKSKDADALARFVCADYRELEGLYLVKLDQGVINNGLYVFGIIETVLEQIEGYKISVNKFQGYNIPSNFLQSGVLGLFLRIITKHVSFTLVSIAHYYKPTMEHPKYNDLLHDLMVMMQSCTTHLMEGALKHTRMAVNEHNVLHVAMMANRVLMMRFLRYEGFHLLYTEFLLALGNQVMHVWCKNSTDIQINLLHQQFCFDKWCVVFDNSDLVEYLNQIKTHINGYLKEQKVEQPIDPALHIVTIWHGMMSITDNLFKQYQKFYRYKFRKLKFKDELEEAKHLKQQCQNHPAMIVTDICALPIQHRNVQDVIAVFEEIEPSITWIKSLPVNAIKFPLGLMPLPRVTNYLPMLFSLLPTVEVLWPVQKNLPLSEQFLEVSEFNNDLDNLQRCYTTIKEVLCIFGKRPEWFMKGDEPNIVFLSEYAEKAIKPRLHSIEEKRKDANRILVNYENANKAAEKSRDEIVRSFTERETKKNEKRKLDRQLKKKSQEKIHQTTVLLLDNREHEELDDNDHADELSDLEFAYKMDALKNGYVQKAREGLSDNREGNLFAEMNILIQHILQVKRQLHAIVVSNKKVNEDQVKSCRREADKWNNQYNRLLADFKTIETTDLLKKTCQSLERALKDLNTTLETVDLKLKKSRYSLIMSFGLKDIENQEVRDALFKLGEHHYVYGKNLNKKDRNKYNQFCKVYEAGKEAFIECGRRNFQKFHKKSPYASMHELLFDLDDMIYSAYVQFDLEEEQQSPPSFSSSSSSYSSSTTAAPKPNVTTSAVTFRKSPSDITKMSASKLLQDLCYVQLMDDCEKQFLSAWVKANPKHLVQLVQEKQVNAALAYECLSAWLVTSDIKERIHFLNETGFLRWLLSIPGEGCLISKEKINDVNTSLDQIADSLRKTSPTQLKVELVLAQALTPIIMIALDRDDLLKDLELFGLKNRWLRQMCDALALSLGCQSALHDYLKTYVRMHLTVPAHSCETVQLICNNVQEFNLSLLKKGNVQIAPAHVLIYGSNGYSPSIPTSKYVPRDVDLRTNLPVDKWQFEKRQTNHLKEQLIYYRVINGERENGVTIKEDKAPILSVVHYVDFGISQAMYDPILGKIIFYTQQAYDDLITNKVISFVDGPQIKGRENPKLFTLRPLIACHNTGFPLSPAAAGFLRTITEIQIKAALQNKEIFLTPRLKPGELLYFLFKHCLDQSAEFYFMSAHQNYILLRLLPFLPITFPMQPTTEKNLREALHQFDEEQANIMKQESGQNNEVKQERLAKLIALVLHTIITPLSEGRTILQQAIMALTNFFSDNLQLVNAVNEALNSYSRPNEQAVSVASQSMFQNVSASAASSTTYPPPTHT